MICPRYAWARMLRLNIVDSYTAALVSSSSSSSSSFSFILFSGFLLLRLLSSLILFGERRREREDDWLRGKNQLTWARPISPIPPAFRPADARRFPSTLPADFPGQPPVDARRFPRQSPVFAPANPRRMSRQFHRRFTLRVAGVSAAIRRPFHPPSIGVCRPHSSSSSSSSSISNKRWDFQKKKQISYFFGSGDTNIYCSSIDILALSYWEFLTENRTLAASAIGIMRNCDGNIEIWRRHNCQLGTK